MALQGVVSEVAFYFVREWRWEKSRSCVPRANGDAVGVRVGLGGGLGAIGGADGRLRFLGLEKDITPMDSHLML